MRNQLRGVSGAPKAESQARHSSACSRQPSEPGVGPPAARNRNRYYSIEGNTIIGYTYYMAAQRSVRHGQAGGQADRQTGNPAPLKTARAARTPGRRYGAGASLVCRAPGRGWARRRSFVFPASHDMTQPTSQKSARGGGRSGPQ